MCSFTGIFPDFTVDAKKLSEAESRWKIDEIMEFDRKLSEPFTGSELAELFKKVDTLAPLGFVEGMQAAEALSEKASQKQVDDAVEDLKICAERRKELDSNLSDEELTELFQKHSWGSRRGWRDYELLTPEEQYFVDKSGWTPEKRTYENNSGVSLVEQRRRLKASIIKTPSFQSCQFHNLDNVKLLVKKHECKEKCFYFINFFSSESIRTSSQKIAKLKKAMPFVADDRTAALWLEVFDYITVDKNKLRPEQVKYLETKAQETLTLLDKCKFDIFDDKHFDCPASYHRNYELLTEAEKQILDKLGLAPVPQEESTTENVFWRNVYCSSTDAASARCDLKKDALQKGEEFFSLSRFRFFHSGFTVSFANGCYWINSISPGFTTCPTPPDLIVEKSKLRPDQIAYLDRKCAGKERADAETQKAKETASADPLAIGKNAVGEPVVLDLDSVPHLLISGAIGTGKSDCVDSMIISMIKKFTPEELKFIMFDPKIVELDIFRDLPHLRMPIVKDTESFVEILRDAAIEIDNRYNILADYGVKNISEYNAGKNEKMPRLVIVIDELYELMKCEDKTDVENVICRIAQKGCAAGVHLLIATEFPRSITGIIKANIPGRLCF